jgi:hypothetical protein
MASSLLLNETGGKSLFLVNKVEVSQIDKIPRQIGQDENRIHAMNGIE